MFVSKAHRVHAIECGRGRPIDSMVTLEFFERVYPKHKTVFVHHLEKCLLDMLGKKKLNDDFFSTAYVWINIEHAGLQVLARFNSKLSTQLKYKSKSKTSTVKLSPRKSPIYYRWLEVSGKGR